MIAQPKFSAPPPRHVERIRTATKRRTRRNRRRVHRPLFAVLTLAVVVVLPLLGYVTLTANLTSLNYALSRAERDRSKLAEESQRLDNKIVQLKSEDRLAAIAVRLKMHDPHVYAVVRVPEPRVQPEPPGIALFSWISGR
jgi:cell division protein FtsL